MREKLNYYECVMNCDIIFKSRATRPEEMDNIYEPPIKYRTKRFYPADPYKNRQADILGLRDGRELERSFTERFEKKVSRHQLDKDGTPMSGRRELKPKWTKIKFVKLDPEDVTESIRAKVLVLPMREIDLKPIKTNEGTDTTAPAKPRVYKRKRVSSAKKVGAQA